MPPDPHASRVVLVGTARYPDPSWDGRQLDAVRAGTEDLAAEFGEIDCWGLPATHRTVVADPQTPEDLIAPIRAAANAATDTLLVYYAGHGFMCAQEGASGLHLTVAKTVDRDPLNAVGYHHVREAVRRSAARRRIVILDCCHAGAALGAMGTTMDQVPIEGTYVLTAVAPHQAAIAPPGACYTAFTGELIGLLRDGIPGAGPELTLEDLYRQLWQRLAARNLPTPCRIDLGGVGDLPLVRNRAGTRDISADVLTIDFGTSNTSAVLRWASGTVQPLRFDDLATLPSAVSITNDGTVRVGRDALHGARNAPEAFVAAPKRHIDKATIELDGCPVPLVDVVAAVLHRVATEALLALGHRPGRLALSHPHTWGPERRAVLEAAALKAGLPRPEFVSEPVAAAAYFTRGRDDDVPPGSMLVVYDFGGGTFDVSTMRRLAPPENWEVVRSDGLQNTGGVHIDEAIVEWLGQRIKERDPDAWRRLQAPTTSDERAERYRLADDARIAKERLSSETSVEIYVRIVDLDVTLTRETFDKLAARVVDRTVLLTAATIAGSDAGPDDVAGIVLIGGSSRIPLVESRLRQLVPAIPRTLPEPELVVAEGALHHLAVGAAAGSPDRWWARWKVLLGAVGSGLLAGVAVNLAAGFGVPALAAGSVAGCAVAGAAYLLATSNQTDRYTKVRRTDRDRTRYAKGRKR